MTFPLHDINPPDWAAHEPTRKLMDEVLLKTKSYTSKSAPVSVEVPGALSALPVDAVVMVSVISHNVGMEKTLGLALLTAGITGGLSGGSMFMSYSVRSGTAVIVNAVDTKTGAVLWHQSLSRPGRGGVGGTAQSFPVLRHMVGQLPNRARKLSAEAAALVAAQAAVEGTAPTPATENVESESDTATNDDVATDDAAAEESTDDIPSELDLAAAAYSALPPLPTDRKEWNRRDAKRAYSTGVITRVEYKEFSRQRKINYRNDIESLEADIKAKKIDKRTGEIQAMRLRWIYSGM